MLTTILTGVLALTAVIVLLVAVLMFCEKKLVKKGKVKLLINDDPAKSPEVDVGSNLLMALSAQKIFLPSACGGKGSCAMCKCQVFEGGGDILPSELTHIKRAEAKEGWRLSCQVKVRGPMKVKVPDAVFGIRKWECTVRSNDNVATFIKELVVDLPKPIAMLQARVIETVDTLSLGLLPDSLKLTRDQVTLLQTDNVVSEAAKAEGRTLDGLGILPTAMAAIVPGYLWTFRKAGQFSKEAFTASEEEAAEPSSPPVARPSGPPIGPDAAAPSRMGVRWGTRG